MKRSSLVDGHGIPIDRVLAGGNRHDSPLLAARLDELGMWRHAAGGSA